MVTVRAAHVDGSAARHKLMGGQHAFLVCTRSDSLQEMSKNVRFVTVICDIS